MHHQMETFHSYCFRREAAANSTTDSGLASVVVAGFADSPGAAGFELVLALDCYRALEEKRTGTIHRVDFPAAAVGLRYLKKKKPREFERSRVETSQAEKGEQRGVSRRIAKRGRERSLCLPQKEATIHKPHT